MVDLRAPYVLDSFKCDDILHQLEKACFQVSLNGLGFIRGERRSPLVCKTGHAPVVAFIQGIP